MNRLFFQNMNGIFTDIKCVRVGIQIEFWNITIQWPDMRTDTEEDIFYFG